MIALLAALATASSTPTATAKVDPYTIQEIAYARSLEGRSAWRLITLTSDLLIFTKPYAGPADGNPKVWMRVEHYPIATSNPLGTGESFVSVHEVECASKRDRTVSSTLYAGPEMGGDIVSASDQPGNWQVVKSEGAVWRAAEGLCAERSPGPASADAPTNGAPTVAPVSKQGPRSQ